MKINDNKKGLFKGRNESKELWIGDGKKDRFQQLEPVESKTPLLEGQKYQRSFDLFGEGRVKIIILKGGLLDGLDCSITLFSFDNTDNNQRLYKTRVEKETQTVFVISWKDEIIKNEATGKWERKIIEEKVSR